MGKCQNKQQKLKDDKEKATETKLRTSFIETTKFNHYTDSENNPIGNDHQNGRNNLINDHQNGRSKSINSNRKEKGSTRRESNYSEISE